MPKKVIARTDSFSDEDEDIDVAQTSRPYMPMDEANGVYDRGVSNPGLPNKQYVPPKVLLEQEQARTRELEQLIEQLQQQGASGLAVQDDGSLVVQGFQLSPVGLVPPEDMSLEAWQQVGELIFRLEGSIQWLIGDWLVYGGAVGWGDLPKLVNALGRDYDTLRNYASVSRNVKLWLRNHNLSYNHHRAVASIEQEEQQDYALKYAAAQGFSVAVLRQWIKLGMPEGWVPDGQPAPALPADHLDIVSVSRDVQKFMQRDPSTFKKKDREAARQHAEHLRRTADELMRHVGLDE